MTFRLVITPVASGQAHTVDLDRDLVLVGRRAGVDVPLPHPEVGGVHLRIEREDGVFHLVVVDAGGAAAGTRLNGEAVERGGRRRLEDGALILVGDAFSIRFEAKGGDRPTPEEGEAGTAAIARAMVRDVLRALGGSGAADGPALEVTRGPGKGRRIELPSPGRDLVIGRGETCEAMIVDPDLSREHLRVRRAWSGATVCDLGSKNGTSLDGERLVPGVDQRLADGARLVAGGTTLVYRDPTEAYLASLGSSEPEPARVPGPQPGLRPAPRPAFPWLPVVVAVALVLAAAAALVLLVR